MRISDWSSDVCSSDLQPIQREHLRGPAIDLAGLQPRQALRDVGQAPVPLRLGLGCDWMIEQAQRARGFAGQWQTRQRIGTATRRVGGKHPSHSEYVVEMDAELAAKNKTLPLCCQCLAIATAHDGQRSEE